MNDNAGKTYTAQNYLNAQDGNGVERHDLSWHLEQAIQEQDADSIGLAHNMSEATLDQLHEIVQFADRLKEGALIEMYGREREADGIESAELTLPPKGYTGYRPKANS